MAVGLIGYDQISSPRNYDECILKYMSGVDSNLGASQIIQSCRKKFPVGSEYAYKERELKPVEIKSLTGRGSYPGYGQFTGEIHNGNESVTVTAIRINLTTKVEPYKTTNELETDPEPAVPDEEAAPGPPGTTRHKTEPAIPVQVGSKSITRGYQVLVKIPPLTASEIKFDVLAINNYLDFSWSVVGGTGFSE